MKAKALLGTLTALGLLAAQATAQVTVTSVITNGLAEPYNVVVDGDNNIYIADSVHNRIAKVDANSGVLSTFSGLPGDAPGSNDGPAYLAHFNSPQGLVLATIGSTAGLVVADTGNHLIRFVSLADGSVTTIAGQAGVPGPAVNSAGASATFRSPLGLAADGSGNVYIADSLNSAIRVINLNDPAFGVINVDISGTTFRQPTAVAIGAASQLWVADTGNHAVKLITLTSPAAGSLTAYMGSDDRHVSGTTDSAYGPNALFNGPRGLLWLGSAGLLIADTGNQTIRLATNNSNFGPNNYAVITFAGIPGQAGLVDGAASLAKFNWPIGLARDVVGNGFLIADLANGALRRIQSGPPQPAVAAPKIGWVDYQKDSFGELLSILRTDQPFVFYNDVTIAIYPEAATETFFTYGPTPPSPLEDTIPTPSRATGTTPPAYHDGMHTYEVPPSLVAPQPDLTIKAIGVQDGRPNSPVAQARFQFKTGNPLINGDNAASFTVSDQTASAQMWYTLDGTDPTNAAPSLGPISSPANLYFLGTTNITFKIRAFRDNYKSSDVVINIFSPTNFVPNRIAFGLTNGEPHSSFLARPGQFFYAPVTLQLQPGGETMYSLQFNVAVTNGLYTKSVIQNGAGIGFFPMLMTQVTPDEGAYFPSPIGGSGQWYLGIPPEILIFSVLTNGAIVSTNVLTIPTTFVNTNISLLGVSWLYRTGFKYQYIDPDFPTNSVDFDTTKQDLIHYSIPHDTLFDKKNGVVVAGAYSFQVPTDANLGDNYFIQLGSPSATRDGIGAPGADVYIQAPATNQVVTITNTSYLVGDVAPFHWLNAGDFGEGLLDNADVMQVFQSGILEVDMPPANSDLFAAMDSSGRMGIWDSANNYYTDPGPAGDMTPGQLSAMLDGNDLTINTNAFGDGVLDVSDVFVTLRRSLDPSLVWFTRFWTNGQFVAVPTTNLAFNTNTPYLLPAQSPVAASKTTSQTASQPPSVLFTAADAVVSAGQTIQIPVNAQILGDYPLRVLGLNITIRPLDGSPGLTQPIQFTPTASLGAPWITTSKHPGNYAAAWLDNTVTGLSGNATIGTLTVTIPTNATSASAYAVHFDHASASPNGIASFPKHAQSGLITLSNRSASSFSDGIPDSWRLRWFGTVYNYLSASNADACGDSINNWQKYVAGTDPTDPKAYPRLNAKTPVSAGATVAIHWPTVSGKQYVIERSSSLFPGSWSTIATNTGTGTDMEFDDASTGSAVFYRVRILP